MKKTLFAICMLASAIMVRAEVLVDDGFDYGSGVDLNGQGGWVSTTNDFIVDSGEALIDGNYGSMVYGGDAIDMQAGDTIQITVDYRVFQTNGVANQTFFNTGLQDSAVPGAAADTNAMQGMVHYSEWNTGSIRSYTVAGDHGSSWFGAITTNECGYDPRNLAGADDYDTDPLRTVYTITKSGITNEFAVEIRLENPTAGFTNSVADDVHSRADLWTAANVYFSLGGTAPMASGTEVYLDNVKIEQIEPVAVAPEWISAVPGDGKAIVSWAAVAGGGNYLLYRSTTSGSFAGPAIEVYGAEYEDTGLSNDTTYFYMVQSAFYNGNSGDSVEAAVTPSGVIVGGEVYATDFTEYGPGDLAATEEWNEIAASGSNAFAVVVTNTDTVADTTPTMTDFDGTEGNAVYLDKLIRNGQDDAVEGYFDVVISATPSEVPEREGHSYFGHQNILDFGLTSTAGESLGFDKAVMSMFNIKVTTEADVEIHFANGSGDQKLLRIWRSDAGWNPQHALSGEWASDTNAPLDLVTDKLRVTWKLRRTRESGQYQAWATISNLVDAAVLPVQTQPYVLYNCQDMYDAENALFAMGHASGALATGDGGAMDSMLNATVYEMALTHTTNNLPAVEAPVITELVTEDRGVLLSWSDVLDALNYTVFLETEAGEIYEIASNISESTLADGPRWNGQTGIYTIRANYDSDLSPEYAEVVTNATPQPMAKVVNMDGSKLNLADLPWGGAKLDMSQTNLVIDPTYVYGTTQTGISYEDRTVTPMLATGETDGEFTYSGPTVYGLTQNLSSNGLTGKVETGDTENYSLKQHNGSQAFTYYAQWGDDPGIGSLQQLAYVQIEDWAWDGAAPESVDISLIPSSMVLGTADFTGGPGWGRMFIRPAIRNGTQWYVAESSVGSFNNGTVTWDDIRITDLMDENWAPLTVTPGTWVEHPGSGSFTHASGHVFTEINAVGWFAYRVYRARVYKLEFQIPGGQSSYAYWSDSKTLEDGVNAEPSDDPDNDGLLNEQEYAFGGDPLDWNDRGTLPEMSIVNEGGIDYLKYVYIVQRDPVCSITAQHIGTGDLMLGFTIPGDAVVTTETLDYYWNEVTVLVPMAGKDKYFVGVDIEQN